MRHRVDTSPEAHMATIDYLKVIDLLAKTLQLERVDIHFPDKSINKIEAVLGREGGAEKKFHLSVNGYSILLSFPKAYLSQKEFYRWLSAFEYECEQAFMKNTSIHANEEAAQYQVTISI